jgi:hypothetical protein
MPYDPGPAAAAGREPDMLRTTRALTLQLAPLLLLPAFAARQTSPAAPPPPVPAPAREAAERRAYDFSTESQLADFDARSGSWSIASGTLWCTSRGAHEELRWRRTLTPRGTLKVTLAGAGHFALEFGTGAQRAAVRVDRSSARWHVEADGHPVLARAFEPPQSGPLAVALRWSTGAFDVRVGDDEEVHAALPDGWTAPFTELSLVSVRSQPRLDDLVIERLGPAVDGTTAAAAAVPGEEQRLAIEQATRKLEAGDAAGALEQIVAQIPPPRAGAPSPLPPAVAHLLQRIGQRDEKLREKEPLKSRYAARVVRAQDGSASLVLPLAADVQVERVAVHRTDGRVLSLKSREPAWSLEVVRYDGKLQYWFGRDPRLVYCSGGGGPTLARARADEQKGFAPKSEWKHDVAKAKQPLDGEGAYSYELLRPDPAREGATTEMRETFALHRGDTWRVTIEGDPAALETAAEDLAFLLSTFRFEKTGG